MKTSSYALYVIMCKLSFAWLLIRQFYSQIEVFHFKALSIRMGNGVQDKMGNISPRGVGTAICIISVNDENINANVSILVFLRSNAQNSITANVW